MVWIEWFPKCDAHFPGPPGEEQDAGSVRSDPKLDIKVADYGRGMRAPLPAGGDAHWRSEILLLGLPESCEDRGCYLRMKGFDLRSDREIASSGMAHAFTE